VPAQQPVATTGKAAEPRFVPARGSDTIDWHHEYAYVMSDLRLLLIVSVALIAIIVLVGLFM
jgi:hypothetical protein